MEKQKQKQDPIIAKNIKQLADYKNRQSVVETPSTSLKLTEVLEITKNDCKKLIYKRYTDSVDLKNITSRLSIYYNESEEFRKWCTEAGISSYLNKGSANLGSHMKSNNPVQKILGDQRSKF